MKSVGSSLSPVDKGLSGIDEQGVERKRGLEPAFFFLSSLEYLEVDNSPGIYNQ